MHLNNIFIYNQRPINDLLAIGSDLQTAPQESRNAHSIREHY